MHPIKGTQPTKVKVQTKSFSITQEAFDLIHKEAERLDRSASWVVNNLALNLKEASLKGAK